MTACERAQAHFNDFLDGTLNAAQSEELSAHLQSCAVCRFEFHALKATQEMVRNAPALDSSESRQRVMARFRQAAGVSALPAPVVAAPRRAWNRHLLPMGTALGAACLLALWIAFPAGRRGEVPVTGGEPILIATASCAATLPTPGDLDQMTSAHAVQSFTVQNGSAEWQQEALADANSRLFPDAAAGRGRTSAPVRQ